MKKIVIIGAGVSGLSSAVKIAEYFNEEAEVLLVSDAVSPYTTGDGSAGLWTPYYCGKTDERNIQKWSSISHKYFHELWKNGQAEETGISMIPIYRLTVEAASSEIPDWHVVPFGFRSLNKKELKSLSDEHNRKYIGGFQYISFCCEPTRFLPYLFKRFIAAGGHFQKKKVFSIEEFNDYDLIINCTGLGSREMLGDQKSHAIRGQVARVKAQWMYHVMLDNSDDGTYVIPNISTVILGGTHQLSDYNLEISKPDSEFIFNGCRQMFPSLANAPPALEWVGLRPGREEVRLDTEFRENAPILINNYGHGGCGITLCWGCSDEVLQRTIEVIQRKSSKL